MAANELLIRINADAKNAKKAFDDVRDQTKELQSSLNTASLVGAAAFAALATGVGFAVHAFGEAEQSSNALSQALQNQGLFSAELKDSYKQFAVEASKKSGLDDDAIIKAQAVAQGYLGQVKITGDLTNAIVDLSTKYGSLDAAATVIGKTIGTNTNALAREGVEIKANASTQERMQAVLAAINSQYKDQAEAANRASFGVNNLKVAFGNLQENIGSRFAPLLTTINTALTKFIDKVNESPALLDLITTVTALGLALSGTTVAFTAGISGYLLLGAAATALGTTIGALLIPFAAVAAAIGVVTFAALQLYRNWDAITLFMGAAFQAAAKVIGEAASGVLEVLNGILTFDPSRVVGGLKKINESAIKGEEEFTKAYQLEQDRRDEIRFQAEEKQNKSQKEAADKRAKEKAAQEAKEAAALQAAENVKLLTLKGASKEVIQLRSEEASILKNLETEKNAAVIAASQERLKILRQLEDEAHIEDLDRTTQFNAEKQALLAELQAQNPDLNTADPALNAELDKLKEQKQLEQDVETKAASDKLQARIKADNDFLANQQKFGKTYATVQKVLQSAEVTAAAELSGELVGLAQSKNSTLKAIGKAAAISQIAISTATSAAKVFADSVILLGPFVGPPVGAALAAARIAYGAEQISNVTAAASGALVEGSGNRDSQPFMLTPGELVTPRKNFEEVVGAVRKDRAGGNEELTAALTALASRPTGNNITFEGDILSEPTFINQLIEKIQYQLDFGNAVLRV